MLEWSYELDEDNYEVTDIMISSKPLYIMKELKEKLFFSDNVNKQINEWINMQKENSK